MKTKDLSVGLEVGWIKSRTSGPSMAYRAIVLDANRWKNIGTWRQPNYVQRDGAGSGIPLAIEVRRSKLSEDGEVRIELEPEWTFELAQPANIIGTWVDTQAAAIAEKAQRKAAAERDASNKELYEQAYAADKAALAELGITSAYIAHGSRGVQAPSQYTFRREDVLKLIELARGAA